MPDNTNPSGSPLTRKKYTPAFKAECVRQVAAGVRQTNVARTQGLSPVLLGRWQHQALAEAVPSSAEREEIKRLHAELNYLHDIISSNRSAAVLSQQENILLILGYEADFVWKGLVYKSNGWHKLPTL